MVDFGWFGLVGGGQAADGVDDEGAVEGEAVFRGAGVGAAGEAGFEQGAIEQVSGGIAGEGAAGAVGAAFAGRQPDNGEPALIRAEAGDGGVEPAGFARAKFGAVRGKPGAELAVWIGGLGGTGLHGHAG